MKRILVLFYTFAFWTLVGVLSKFAFFGLYSDLLTDTRIEDYLKVLWNGFFLDVAIAGYISLIPGLLLVAVVIIRNNYFKCIWHCYMLLIAMVYSVAIVANLGLYGAWGFPLDSTPLLYITTSLKDALASVTLLQMVVSVISILLIVVACYHVSAKVCQIADSDAGCLLQRKTRGFVQKKLLGSVVLLLLTAMLIIPIRGGFGTGTNHTGAVYFSQNMRLNHAAVNPVFNFIESVIHKSENLSSIYESFTLEEAQNKVKHLKNNIQEGTDGRLVNAGDSVGVNNPNVVFIGLESFSKYIMTEGGCVEGVVPNLERIADEGWYFTHFYANSFRTDRALVSMLSGMPSLPNMSIMDLPQISTFLPSIARSLGNAGYQTSFYYGGDTNYSNMRSYLVGTGFQSIVSDKDFDKKLHTGKWGVADGPVFERVLDDIKKGKDHDAPFYIAIMTSSSHEPFDVPDYHVFPDLVLNAFSYTDNELGRFIDGLKSTSVWDNTLVVIVPDHSGAYPENLDNYEFSRYELPFIVTGGVIKNPKHIDTLGSQMDIAATVLGILGIDSGDFDYSKNILDDRIPHFGVFTFPDAIGMITDSTKIIYDYTSRLIAQEEGIKVDSIVDVARAYMQLYAIDIDSRQTKKVTF